MDWTMFANRLFFQRATQSSFKGIKQELGTLIADRILS
jgi:hypothetical protein